MATDRYATRALKDNFDAPTMRLSHPLQCSRCDFATFRQSEAVEHEQGWNGHRLCHVLPEEITL